MFWKDVKSVSISDGFNINLIFKLLKKCQCFRLILYTFFWKKVSVLKMDGEAGTDACVWTRRTFGSSRYGRTNLEWKHFQRFFAWTLSIFCLNSVHFRFRFGPQLFNSLPPFLRNMTKCSVEIFKEELDKYMMTIPDEPSVPGLTPTALTPDARPSNSLLHQRPRQTGREERRGRTRPGA